MAKLKYTREQIQNTLQGKGYKYFVGYGDSTRFVPYDINIVGIRNSKTKNRVTNAFDDLITLSYINEQGEWQYHEYGCTTEPGSYWTEKKLINKDGTAILKPGQYRKSHKIGLHQGKYEALVQRGKLTVYRDGDMDNQYDLNEDDTQNGLFGINIHRATAKKGGKSIRVDKWSAGCQVIASNEDYTEFMSLVNKAKDNWGNNFTYTLIESKEIVAL